MIDLEYFIKNFSNNPQIFIPDLPKDTVIYMFTKNSTYTIKVVEPFEAQVIVSGGYFKRKNLEPYLTHINGSTMGGSMIYLHKLVEGLFCEFENNVITSRIKKIFINHQN